MSQFVIEFGAPTLDPVLQALLATVERLTVIDFALVGKRSSRRPATAETIASIAAKFAGGADMAVFRTEIEAVRYGLIVAPRFDGEERSCWLGTIEITSDGWPRFWTRLLEFEGLHFVCVGKEEGVEITDARLAVDSFPWDEWPLVVGALRSKGEGSDWTIRRGPTS